MDLPTGWRSVPLGSLVDVLDGRRVPVNSTERAGRPGPVPYYGAAGRVGWIDEVLFDEELLLLGEDGVQFFDPAKPKAYRITGPAWVNNHAHVLRAGTEVDWRFLEHFLNWFDYRGFANGTTRLKLTQATMRRIPVTLPSLREQQRIVEILEDHLSRLDAANAYLDAALRRAERLAATEVWHLTHAVTGGAPRRLDAIGEVRLGRQRSPANHQGARMRPYLRAANVDWNRLRLESIKEMNFTEVEERTYRLQPGDILLVEASGSAAEAGKSVVYEGTPAEVCFQNTLLRVRCAEEASPYFVQKYLLAEAMAGRFIEGSRGVGINHIGRAKLASLEVVLPTLAEQRQRAERCDRALDAAQALREGIRSARGRSTSLRRALLSAAFSGRLTGRSSDLDLAEEMALP